LGLPAAGNSANFFVMSSFSLSATSLRTSLSAFALALGGLLLLRPARR